MFETLLIIIFIPLFIGYLTQPSDEEISNKENARKIIIHNMISHKNATVVYTDGRTDEYTGFMNQWIHLKTTIPINN